MTSRTRTTWSIFAACLVLVGLALFWVTREVLDLERREAAAKDEAHRHEAMRLALWRMDSALAPIIAQEAAQAPFDGRVPALGGYVPPPVRFEGFRLYFTIDQRGIATPPEIAPFAAAFRPPAPRDQSGVVDEPKREDAPASKPASDPDVQLKSMLSAVPMPPLPNPAAPQQSVQLELSNDEYQSRAKMARNAQVSNFGQTLDTNDGQVQTILPDAFQWRGGGLIRPEAGPLEPRWLIGPSGNPELFLVRSVRDPGRGHESVQGIWADWPKLEKWLLENTTDLFAGGRLFPAQNPSRDDQAASLATIPARFVPGDVKRTWENASTPTRLVLVVAWVAAIAAIAAVGGVLRAAMSLGERRGRFVSAVTHELRTPLTTFRMYSQMLADGMVPDSARPEYLATLKSESERLSRVVESVLLYSRLEEGRGGAHREVIRCDALLERVLPTLRKRAEDGGMTPEVTVVLPEEAQVEVDVQAVEQILLNLVDNACKYAHPADPRLRISCRVADRRLQVTCRDFGPGIPADEGEAVFLAFRRGARDAAGTTPGVGLGLSLARGLARALGGDLVLEPASPGASFVLTIPL